jgi:hypothetical protein
MVRVRDGQRGCLPLASRLGFPHDLPLSQPQRGEGKGVRVSGPHKMEKVDCGGADRCSFICNAASCPGKKPVKEKVSNRGEGESPGGPCVRNLKKKHGKSIPLASGRLPCWNRRERTIRLRPARSPAWTPAVNETPRGVRDRNVQELRSKPRFLHLQEMQKAGLAAGCSSSRESRGKTRPPKKAAALLRSYFFCLAPDLGTRLNTLFHAGDGCSGGNFFCFSMLTA